MDKRLNVPPSHRAMQLEIVLKTNPAPNDYLTWIRGEEDIVSFSEALDNCGVLEDLCDLTPDFTADMIRKAIETNEITVYSSYPIEQGIFVTPSKMEAQAYAGDKTVFEKTVSLDKVAWIDELQGQFTDVEQWMQEHLSSLNEKISDAATVSKENTLNYHREVSLDR